MRSFWSYITNGKYSIGCTGQTVYLYDENNNEITKFKDIKYAYTPMFSPDGKLFLVKSTDGRLAVYSLETFSLIKKFRFSKVNFSQDDGFCFSPDGSLFLNIERHNGTASLIIAIYNTDDFSLVKQVLLNNNMTVTHIEYDHSTNDYYVLGFINENRFVAKFIDYEIKNITYITEKEFEFYLAYKDSQMRGFSTTSFELAGLDQDTLKEMNHTFAKLYMYHNKTAE